MLRIQGRVTTHSFGETATLQIILNHYITMAIEAKDYLVRLHFYVINIFLMQRLDLFLKGDAGYPLLPWLITPFRSAGVNTQKSRFNKSHSSGRNIIERTIGVWKNWCRCLLGAARHLHYSPEKAVKIINVVAAIHNVRIHFNVPEHEEPPIQEENETVDDILDETNSAEDQNYSSEANEFRNQVLLSF